MDDLPESDSRVSVSVRPQGGELPAPLSALAERARAYARAAQSPNTVRAYAADWRHYSAWLADQGLGELPPDPARVGLYITACASGTGSAAGRPDSVRTIERRLAAICWTYAQRGSRLDRQDRHIRTVLAGIRRTQGRPPAQKEAILPEHLRAMIAALGATDLRAWRDRALLLVGFAGALRRSELVGLDCGPDQTPDGAGWIEILPDGLLLKLRGKTGWREVEVGQGRPATCPVIALRSWLETARIAHGPVFRAISKGGSVGSERLTDKHVVRLVKRLAVEANIRPDLTDVERAGQFAGHSLRAGLASSAEAEERFVQKQLGHASAEMTRRYQHRRERFRVNLTKAAGL